MIFQTLLHTQLQYLQMFAALNRSANESLSAAWRNTEDFQRRHGELVGELLQAQGRLATEQWVQALGIWRSGFRAYEAAQTQTLEASQPSAAAQAEDAGEVARRLAQAAHSAPRPAGKRPRSTAEAVQQAIKKAGAWDGTERRAKVLTAYPGVERRSAA